MRHDASAVVMRKLLLLLALGVVVPGCLGADGPVDPASPSGAPSGGNVTIDASRPDPSFGGNVTLGAEAPPDVNATLDAAPRLQVGEWWRIRLESPLDGTSSEFVRVVAAIDGDTYVFGMPHEGWWKEAVIYHTPAFGDVNAADLSYNTHDVLFTPLQFPLVDGATWTTEFSGGPPMTASVTVTSPTEATVTFTSPACGPFGLLAAVGQCGGENTLLELVYDATIHEVREFKHPTVTFTVVAHGYDYQGWVTVPRGEDLVFFHGRIGPALDIGLQPAPSPLETVNVNGGFNRVSFIQVVQSIGGAPGAYREAATAPDGTQYVTEGIPASSPFTIVFHEAADPDGDWQLEHLAGGPGVVFIEGIAYHQYDVHLPSGAIRSDHSHEVIR